MRIPTLYMACLPPGRYLVLDTIFSMSNAELLFKNEEVEIRNGIRTTNFEENTNSYFVPGTWYIVPIYLVLKKIPLKLIVKALQSAIPLSSSFLVASKKLVPKGKFMGTFGVCTNLRDHPIVGVT